MLDNSHLTHYRETFEKNIDEIKRICDKFADKIPDMKDKAADFAKRAKSRLQDNQPKIMVYGIYNAGKSTMLNALMGKAEADMDDRPTTHRVQEYKWRDYIISDTPGIDAPEEDEKVSKEQLKESDVILFVMSSEGAFSLNKNFEELIGIVRSGKHLLVVINNKSDHSIHNEPEYFDKIKRQIFEHFSGAMGLTPDEISQRVKCVVVNALEALGARTNEESNDNERQLFLEDSNIIELEDRIIAEYKRTNAFTILKQECIEFQSLLDELKKSIEAIPVSEDSKRAQNARNDIYGQIDDIHKDVSDFVRREANQKVSQIYDLLSKSSEEAVKQELEKMNVEFTASVVDYAKERLEHASKRLNISIQKYGELSSSTPVLNILEQSNSLQYNANEDKDSRNKSEHQGKNKSDAIKDSIFASLATSLLPIPGAKLKLFLTVASGLVGALLGNSNKEEEREYARLEREKERKLAIESEFARRKQELHDASARIANQLADNIISQLYKVVEQPFNSLIDEYSQQGEKADEKAHEIRDALTTIRNIRLQLKRDIEDFGD